MTIGITYKTSRYVTTNTAATITGTTAWTPAANSLLLAFVCTTYSSSPSDPTGVTGHGATYSQVTLGTSTLSTTHKLSLWVAKAGASPTSAVASAALTTTNGTGDSIIEFEITGTDLSGTALQAIVTALASNNGSTGTSATLTLSAASNAANRAMTFIVHLDNSNPAAAGTWQLTAGASGSHALPATGAAAFFDNGTFNTAGAATVANNAAWRMVGIELKNLPTTHATSGALAAQAAAIAGSAQHRHTTAGVLAAQASAVVGAAKHPHVAAGVLAAQAAAVTGAAQDRHAATGALAATAAHVVGAALHPHTSAAALASAAASIAGTAAAEHPTSGALAASAATLAAAAQHPHLAAGDLLAAHATAAASAARTSGATGAHSTSGELEADSATLDAAAARIASHAASGALAADAAQVAASTTHGRSHDAAGDLLAGAVTVTTSPPPPPPPPIPGAWITTSVGHFDKVGRRHKSTTVLRSRSASLNASAEHSTPRQSARAIARRRENEQRKLKALLAVILATNAQGSRITAVRPTDTEHDDV